VRTLGALEARYADDHVPLALILGAIGALSAVRRLLPDAPGARSPTADVDSRPPPEAFIALLLGAVATHDRILSLFGTPPAAGGAGAERAGDPAHRLDGLLR
jgi:hypothetical protein